MSLWLPPLAIAILASIAVLMLYLAQVIFVPLALGIILAFLLHPLVRLVERARVPRIPAVVTVVVLISAALTGVGVSVGNEFQTLARELRTDQAYMSNLEGKVADLRRFMSGGVMADLEAVLDRVGSNLEGPDADASGDRAILVQAEPESQFSSLVAAVSPLLGPLGTMALAIALVIFILISREDLRNRIISLFGRNHLSATTRAFDAAGRRIGRYLLMQLIINASYGFALGVVLLLVGVPYPLLWALLAALLRYVPYVGPFLGAIFPIGMSLVAFDGWSEPFLVIAFIVGLELFSNMVMEPVLFGQSVGISAVGLIIAAGFWTLLWGPVGLLIATPLTVCLVVLGQHVPQFRFFLDLLGDEQVLPPHASYYQRLLARDQQEAGDLAQTALRTSREPAHVCDSVLLPALLQTRRDRTQERISAEDEAYILQSTRFIVGELGRPQPGNHGGLLQRLGAVAAWGRPLSSADGGDSVAATVPPTSDNAASSQSRQPRFDIVACPSHHEVEELAIEMLAAAIGPTGHHVHALTTRTLPGEIVEVIRQRKPDAVFVAVIPPSGFLQASYLCRRLRKTFPELPIIVGYWGKKSRFDDVLVKLRSRGASFVTTSIGQTQKQISGMIESTPSANLHRPERSQVHASHSNY
ncbi:AI-2E family transporter [Alienimonas californiensis]|uniref:AI-2E family transporter n=1 Tax=Alienimonas californiensis TaxID=2527989 RepID=UPI0013FD013C|nr:AI-2E family transporter [Alienimonas californiensis]